MRRDSERSDECIDFSDFTMMRVSFVFVYNITCRNNASISDFGGGFQWQSEYPWYIMEVEIAMNQKFVTRFSKSLQKL
ncbi:Uncharacterized protein FWK35_00026036 [Aphis craccivora]|uniref:Uncharacterized protein n=1 Tax=Aphis craccivora TaxID=307492 RepID=A0A6G0Y401_APHCR|nr:Uncharacterized protein FWK35_00026036 [Aphis craccivora]